MPEQPHVVQVAQPTEQGVAIVVADYVSLLLERDWNVTLACPAQGGLADIGRQLGARVVTWQAQRSPGPAVISESRSLARLLAAANPDVVHLHSSKAGLDGRLALRGRVPTLFSPHAWSFLHGGKALRRAALAWERTALKWTDELVCGSADELVTGKEFGMSRPAIVVPNAVDVSQYAGMSQAEARELVSPAVPWAAPLVVCVGRLVEQKGQDVLLAAWPKIRSAVPDAQLVLVGGGAHEDELRAQAGAGVHITGEVTREVAMSWVRSADVVAAPSRWETLSLAVLEALSLGRPVVAADAQGMREAVDNGAGAIVPKDDPGALATELIPYLTDRGYAASQGKLAAANYQAKWSQQMFNNGDLLDSTYRSLIRVR